MAPAKAETKKRTPRKKKATENALLVAMTLDMSGSMGSVWDSAIEGANDYIEQLRKQEGETLFTLTVWDSQSIDHLCVATPIAEAPLLNRENYCPRGATPLYDAIGKTVEQTQVKLKELDRQDTKALVVVLTDGYENASREYTRDAVVGLVNGLEAGGDWTFVYLGASPSLEKAQQVAMDAGFQSGNAMMFAANAASVKATSASLSGATHAYRSHAGSTQSFYEDAGQTVENYTGSSPDTSGNDKTKKWKEVK